MFKYITGKEKLLKRKNIEVFRFILLSVGNILNGLHH